MELMTPEEVAKELKVSPFTVRRLLRVGTLPGVKIGQRQWRVRREDLEAFINDQVAARHPIVDDG